MSYKYFYHVRIDAEGVTAPSVIEQLRNEPLTARFYRDVLRWHLSDCCPWRKEYPAGLPQWARCTVYRVTGCFEEHPQGERHIYEEDMEQVAVFMWCWNDVLCRPLKYYTIRRPDGKCSACWPF